VQLCSYSWKHIRVAELQPELRTARSHSAETRCSLSIKFCRSVCCGLLTARPAHTAVSLFEE
jgi:hypothetical protein